MQGKEDIKPRNPVVTQERADAIINRLRHGSQRRASDEYYSYTGYINRESIGLLVDINNPDKEIIFEGYKKFIQILFSELQIKGTDFTAAFPTEYIQFNAEDAQWFSDMLLAMKKSKKYDDIRKEIARGDWETYLIDAGLCKLWDSEEQVRALEQDPNQSSDLTQSSPGKKLNLTPWQKIRLTKAVAKNYTNSELTLFHGKTNSEWDKSIIEVIEQNKYIKCLHLPNNKASEKEINENLRYNRLHTYEFLSSTYLSKACQVLNSHRTTYCFAGAALLALASSTPFGVTIVSQSALSSVLGKTIAAGVAAFESYTCNNLAISFAIGGAAFCVERASSGLMGCL